MSSSATRVITLSWILTIVTVTMVGLSAQTKSPFAGTWKLNLAKSKYDPGPAPMGSTVKIEAIEGGERAAVDQM